MNSGRDPERGRGRDQRRNEPVGGGGRCGPGNNQHYDRHAERPASGVTSSVLSSAAPVWAGRPVATVLGCGPPGGTAAQPERDAGHVHEQEDHRGGVRQGVSVVGGRRLEPDRQRGHEHAPTARVSRVTSIRGASGRKVWIPCLTPPLRKATPSTSKTLASTEPTKRRLDDRREPFSQGEYGHEQLGQVPEARLQQARGARAQVLSDLLDRLAHHRRQGGDGQAGKDEPGDVVGADSRREAGRQREDDRADDGQALRRLEGIDSAGHVGDLGRRYSGRSGDVVQ